MSKLIKAHPADELQWQKAGASDIYSLPITTALQNGLDDICNQISTTTTDTISTKQTGKITIGNNDYPFTFEMTLKLKNFDYSHTQKAFKYSTMILHYSLKYDDYSKTCQINGDKINHGKYIDFQAAGNGNDNTKEEAKSILKTYYKNAILNNLVFVARELLLRQIKPTSSRNLQSKKNIIVAK